MKIFFLVLGLVCLVAGSIGVVLPILPSTPFFLAAAFCFAKSSERLHRWFLSTKLYRNHLESFVKRRAMRLRTKISIMVTVTVVLAVGFVFMRGFLVGQGVLLLIWILHMVYFTLRIKTLRKYD